MAIRDLENSVNMAITLAPAARTNGTATGTIVDMLGYDSGMAVVQFGAVTDGTHTPSLLESADGTTFTAVAAADLNGTFAAVTTAGANTVQRVGYQGAQRFIRAHIVTAGATTGGLSNALIAQGDPARRPV